MRCRSTSKQSLLACTPFLSKSCPTLTLHLAYELWVRALLRDIAGVYYERWATRSSISISTHFFAGVVSKKYWFLCHHLWLVRSVPKLIVGTPPPPGGGLLFVMFQSQKVGGRGNTTLVGGVGEGGSSSSKRAPFEIISNRDPPGGWDFLRSKLPLAQLRDYFQNISTNQNSAHEI